MLTVIVISIKGGVGKSTLCTNLACAALAAREKAGIVDTDAQASATAWKRVREDAAPLVVTVGPDDLARTLKTARQSTYTSVWVDSAGTKASGLSESVPEADFALIPILPSPADVLTAFESADVAKKAKTPFGFVLNSVPSRSQEAVDARTVLAKLGHVFATEIRDRLAYRRAFGAGLSVLESDPGSSAAAEIGALYSEIMERINAS